MPPVPVPNVSDHLRRLFGNASIKERHDANGLKGNDSQVAWYKSKLPAGTTGTLNDLMYKMWSTFVRNGPVLANDTGGTGNDFAGYNEITSVSVTSGDGSVTVDFDVTMLSETMPFIGFEYSLNDEWQLVDPLDPEVRSITIAGLTNETLYSIKLRAVRDDVDSYSYTSFSAFPTNPDNWIVAFEGGTRSIVDGYAVHVFSSIGTSTLTLARPGSGGTVEALVVAGGGGGGASGGSSGLAGGGGGGGVLYNSALSLTSDQTITVGAGGLGPNVGGGQGASGSNSSLGSLMVAVGGGGGGIGATTPTTGGSGGGAGVSSTTSYSGAAGTSGQGFAGGSSLGGTSSVRAAGGGGGASSSGSSGTSGTGGAGGSGYSSNISGTYNSYGAGGGGAGASTGLGGGGVGGDAGASGSAAGKNAVAATGSGGGGGYFSGRGGNGADGVVIVRYLIQT
jgi:hypothetical protein